MIRQAIQKDAIQLAEIYNYYILNSTVTFEEQELSKEEMAERILKIINKFPYIVYLENERIIGYAYATEWRSRSGYRYSAELSVYIDKDCCGRGIGPQLYDNLIEQLKQMKFHVLIGGIVLPNPVSVSLHEKFGFKKMAHFKEVGRKFEQWLDVGYWELIINE